MQSQYIFFVVTFVLTVYSVIEFVMNEKLDHISSSTII